MKRLWILRGLKFLVIAAVAVTAFGYFVMSLWNWVVPAVTGLHAITWLQAVALLVLSRILFGSLHRHSGGWHWRHRMGERWQQMTPEERERFRDAVGTHRHCGPRAGTGQTASGTTP